MNEPDLTMSTLRTAGFTLAEHETAAGYVARAERGQQSVEVAAPTRAEAWQSGRRGTRRASEDRPHVFR
jgi:hypothetical protein